MTLKSPKFRIGEIVKVKIENLTGNPLFCVVTDYELKQISPMEIGEFVNYVNSNNSSSTLPQTRNNYYFTYCVANIGFGFSLWTREEFLEKDNRDHNDPESLQEI